jgi:hypothetical protein
MVNKTRVTSIRTSHAQTHTHTVTHIHSFIFPLLPLQHRANLTVSWSLLQNAVGPPRRVISWSQGLYLHRTTQHRGTKNLHPCPKRDSNPRSSVGSLKHISLHGSEYFIDVFTSKLIGTQYRGLLCQTVRVTQLLILSAAHCPRRDTNWRLQSQEPSYVPFHQRNWFHSSE